jgi:hypothetical protein
MKVTVYYWKDIGYLVRLGDGVKPTPEQVETDYAAVWTGEMPDDTQPDDVFGIFNGVDDKMGNPLASDAGQENILSLGVKHTSMSIGDVLRLDSRFLVCMPVDWEPIEMDKRERMKKGGHRG